MAKTWLDLITPYQSGDHADGGDFTFTETTNYDGGTFEQTDRYHHIYSLKSADIGTDDVVITGIRVTNDEETYLYGEEGYILEIEDNPFSIGKEQEVATHLGQKIIGMQFRPLNVTSQSNPLIEAGDPAYVSHKGNSYKCFITNSTFTIGQSSQLSCDAESYQGRRVQGLSGSTKAIIQARRVAKKEISSYDLAMQQLTNLMTNSFGVFKSEESLEDGSIIYYMHDKPTIAESQTIWKMTANTFTVSTDGGQTWNAGFDSSGNAVVNVLNAIGINAEWVRAGKLMSTNGQSYIDLDNNKFVSDNVDFTGKITATSGKISGFDIQDNQLSVTFSKTFGPFTSTDLAKVQGFVLKTNTPTNADFEKYDMTGKRSFSVVDTVYVQRMVEGTDPNPRTISYTLKLKTGQTNNMIEITSSIGTSIKNNIGAGGITTHTGTFNRIETELLYVGNRRIYVDEEGNVKSAPI